jgi:hypothetical protein
LGRELHGPHATSERFFTKPSFKSLIAIKFDTVRCRKPY